MVLQIVSLLLALLYKYVILFLCKFTVFVIFGQKLLIIYIEIHHLFITLNLFAIVIRKWVYYGSRMWFLWSIEDIGLIIVLKRVSNIREKVKSPLFINTKIACNIHRNSRILLLYIGCLNKRLFICILRSTLRCY